MFGSFFYTWTFCCSGSVFVYCHSLSSKQLLNFEWLNYSLTSSSKLVIHRQKCFGGRAGNVSLDLIHSKLGLNRLIRHGFSSRSLWATMMNTTQIILEDRSELQVPKCLSHCIGCCQVRKERRFNS